MGSSSSIGGGANERVVTNCWTLLLLPPGVIILEYQFPGKVGSDLGGKKTYYLDQHSVRPS